MTKRLVALHTEGVDRNWKRTVFAAVPRAVALHTEGVDRNANAAAGLSGPGSRPPHGGRG